MTLAFYAACAAVGVIVCVLMTRAAAQGAGERESSHARLRHLWVGLLFGICAFLAPIAFVSQSTNWLN